MTVSGPERPARGECAALLRLLTRHEGRRPFPYLDMAGKLTIGVGHNLTDRGLSGAEIDLLLANDITAARAACRRLYGDAFDTASKGRRHALVSMAFNLGQTRLAGFKRLRAAVLAGDWDRAAAEALESRWASQTGRRAAEVAALLRGG
ncbi:MAG: glycoside hydrolase family protein [Pseudomonadota bacterium]|nr:glycoside hydrolase family protein [Pseudomonadota bacterium]